VNVGILGGAFDPPHVGHVELARRAIAWFDLDRLLVRVVEQPGHKDVATAPQVRLLLAELAFGPLDEAEVSLDPFARTVDSLAALALDDPLFLVGADEFAAFLGWKEPARVLELARLGVATRPGVDRARLDAVLARLDRPERVSFFEIDPLPVSSSGIRARAAAGEPLDGLVPAAVAAEIARLGLYRDR
jgi:nicotinate-nucleotide adenylyltransferase